jgi:hypothetical protein
LRCRDRRQPAGGCVGEEIDHGVVARGVLVEHPPDEGRSFLVDFDGPVFTPLLIPRSDVQITKWRAHRGAVGGDFLGESFGDFGGEVLGVKLGDRGHDPVQQHAGRRLVDVLRRGHQRDPGVEEGPVDRNAQYASITHTRDEWLTEQSERWVGLDPVAYPFLHAAAADLREHDDRDQFIAGLDLLLTGIRGGKIA